MAAGTTIRPNLLWNVWQQLAGCKIAPSVDPMRIPTNRIHNNCHDVHALFSKSVIQPRDKNVIDRTDLKPIRDEFAKLASAYNLRWRRYLWKSTDQTLAALDLTGNEHILDLGCGTGFLLRHAADKKPGLCLVGIDISHAMLQQARCANSNPAAFIEADACRLPFPDAVFDAVVITNVLHYVPDVKQLFSEAVRVLRPGGRIAITTWDEEALSSRLRAAWINWSRRAPVYLHFNLWTTIQCSGFRIISVNAYSVGVCWKLKTFHAVLTDIPESQHTNTEQVGTEQS